MDLLQLLLREPRPQRFRLVADSDEGPARVEHSRNAAHAAGTLSYRAEARGLLNLQGHRSVGGMRASIYNAVDIQGVNALVSYMAEFEKEHG